MSIANPKGESVVRRYLPSGPDLWLTLAAQGPNWRTGPPEYKPATLPSGLESGRTVQISANYGNRGSLDGWPRPSWDNMEIISSGGNPFPTNIPQLPLWNTLPPQVSYGLQVMTPKQYAAYQAGTKNNTVPVPVQFNVPGTATLVLGR